MYYVHRDFSYGRAGLFPHDGNFMLSPQRTYLNHARSLIFTSIIFESGNEYANKLFGLLGDCCDKALR